MVAAIRLPDDKSQVQVNNEIQMMTALKNKNSVIWKVRNAIISERYLNILDIVDCVFNLDGKEANFVSFSHSEQWFRKTYTYAMDVFPAYSLSY